MGDVQKKDLYKSLIQLDRIGLIHIMNQGLKRNVKNKSCILRECGLCVT